MPEAEKHGVWGPVLELTITSPYVQSRDNSNTFTTGNPMPESTLTLCQSTLFPSQGLGIFVSDYSCTTQQEYSLHRPQHTKGQRSLLALRMCCNKKHKTF